jgi:hypothetical protein
MSMQDIEVSQLVFAVQVMDGSRNWYISIFGKEKPDSHHKIMLRENNIIFKTFITATFTGMRREKYC